MKTKVFLKTVALSAVILFGSIVASAANKNNLIYNSEEKDGVMVGQTVYKMDGSTLANYMKYSYKYDDQKRMTESETMKWNSTKNAWENDLRVCYVYQGKSLTTTYYKWNSKQKTYVLVPDMTVTMDNPNL
ncbi:DUF3836 domain-containing protein [Bacteroides stercorirosoris]|uniref:DUF3836 domain-containing protein n=1 Tax=Bacteroides stercorirosoris TaxID=871324 RepID=A0A1M6CSK9_9BACE|nr:DUF3836 domain-containing protein [Bacteroides stercorirosoris]OKZ06498.1 MAG: hypothetical protein BHV75_18615 [Bacteroides oleiciplenus]SHI64075.1 Family of unknown function [Bacteroides stercorirosoris]